MQMTTEQNALRISRLAAILPATAAAFENGFEAQSPTPRYIAIEYSIGGPVEYKEAIWAYQYDDLVQIAQAIDASETADLGNTVVWDLDTNQQLGFATRVVSFFDPSTKKRIDIPTPVTTRAFVEVSGGVVQNVGSDAPLQLRVIDYDTDFSDGQFVDVPQFDGTTGAAAIADWTISHGDSNYVSKMFSLR